MKAVKHFVMGALPVLCAALVVLGHVDVYANDMLVPGEELKRGDSLKSANGQYRLILQRDGNLVLYGPRDRLVWATNTQGIPVVRCVMQPDGNLVLYIPNDQSVWNSGTQQRPGSFLWLQNNGNLVIYQPVWGVANEQQHRGGDHRDRRDHDREEDK